METRQQRLSVLFASFEKEVDDLRAHFTDALMGQIDLDHTLPQMNRLAAWHCVMELFDAWVRFCKNAVMICASGRVVTRQGTPIKRCANLGWNEEAEAKLQALYLQNGFIWGQHGPAWEVPSETIQAARTFAIANLTQFELGIRGAAGTVSELKACRNYLAHRHRGTATRGQITHLQRRLRAVQAPPASLAARYVPGRGVRLFEEWCIDLKQHARTAIA